MAFPLSIEGEIRLGSPSELAIEPFLQAVIGGLQRAQASSVQREGSRVSFTAGMFRFVGSWNLLVAVDRGVIEVVPGLPTIVRFHFSCRHMLAVATLGVMWLASAPFTDGEYGVAAVVAVVGWLWLFGVNYATAAFRLRRFVRQRVQEHGLQRPA